MKSAPLWPIPQMLCYCQTVKFKKERKKTTLHTNIWAITTTNTGKKFTKLISVVPLHENKELNTGRNSTERAG